MKNILFAIALAGTSIASFAATSVEGMGQYVYPANRTAYAALNFMPDGQSYLRLSDDSKRIEKYDTQTGKLIETVLDVANTRGDQKLERISGYTVSADGKKFLVYQHSEPIYRRSFRATYFIYDQFRNTLKPLSTTHAMQQAPVMSPDGRMVAFMAADNNIYIHKVDYGTEVAVTTDGAVNKIINGVPDWTYEEEFTTSRSMEWAPDNSSLAWIKYNEEAVPAFSFAEYEGACNPQHQYALYPGEFTYKYPVAGEPNSKVSLHSYDVETRKTKEIKLPGSDIEYIPSIHFGPEASQLIVTTLNREQNRLDIYKANPRSTVAKVIHQEKSVAWVTPETYETLTFEADGMVIRSDRTGYSHLYRLSYDGIDLGAITSGNHDVTAYYGRTPDGTRYYQSAENGAINRVVYRVDAKGKKTAVSPLEGWSSLQWAKAGNYYVLNHSTSQQPPIYSLHTTGTHAKKLRKLEDNAKVAAKFASAPRKEFIKVISDGQELNAWIIKPTDFDPAKKYPVIMTQYSGPGSQEVRNAWGIDWMQYAATQGYVVACVDGRGTGARGRKFEQCTYKNLGHYETIDQCNFLTYLQGLPWVDAKRVGMCGWSYGGYETLMCASSGAPFAAACAIAPVTSWRYYDTVYAERYMSTPAQNESGYDTSAPIHRVAKMKCPLLLMSGTADDNVHMSNTIELTARLINLNRWPEMLLFPNMNHSINGCNTRALVYTRMLNFFDQNL